MTLNTLEQTTRVADLTDTESPTEHPAATAAASKPDVEETLSKDVIFELLKNQRRRDALAYLRENDGVATLSDMAEFIAAKENDITVAQLSSSQRKRVYIGLYQCHLPKMATSGVVDFDKNRGDIALRPLAEQLEPYLGESTTPVAPGVPPSRINMLVAGAVGVGVTAGLAGAPVFGLVPAAGWAVISTVALMGLTGLESYRRRS